MEGERIGLALLLLCMLNDVGGQQENSSELRENQTKTEYNEFSSLWYEEIFSHSLSVEVGNFE